MSSSSHSRQQHHGYKVADLSRTPTYRSAPIVREATPRAGTPQSSADSPWRRGQTHLTPLPNIGSTEQQRRYIDVNEESTHSSLKRKNAEDFQPRKRDTWAERSSLSPLPATIAPHDLQRSVAEPELLQQAQLDGTSRVDNAQNLAAGHENAYNEAEEDEEGENDGDNGESDGDGNLQSGRVTRREPVRRRRRRNHGGSLSESTLKNYESYQKHWREWCKRKRYDDGDRVTGEKFVSWAEELMAAEEYRDDENPHLSVLPLHKKRHYNNVTGPMTAGTVNNYLAAVRLLHISQRMEEDPVLSDERGELPRGLTKDMLKKYKERLENPGQASDTENGQNGQQVDSNENTNDNPNANTEDNTNDISSYNSNKNNDKDSQNNTRRRSGRAAENPLVVLKKTMQKLWTSNPTDSSRDSWKTAARNRFLLAFDRFAIVSHHDVSSIQLNHLHLLHIASETDEDVFTTGIAITKAFKKKYEEPTRYSMIIRERDVHTCPVGALAFHLLAQLSDKDTLSKIESDSWAMTLLTTMGNDPNSKVGASSARSQLRAVNTAIREGAGSSLRFLEPDNGIIEELVNDGFGVDNLTTWFMPGYQKAVELFMLTTTRAKASTFRLPRDNVLPSEQLQRQLFPFVENMFPKNRDWKSWIDNIMMDRPMEEGRNPKHAAVYKRASYSTIRLMVLLVRLRRIILQDFAVMMVAEDANGGGASGDGERHMSFVREITVQYPVLSSPAFLEFAASLRKSMASGSGQSNPVPIESSAPMDEDVLGLIVQQGASTTATVTTARTLEEDANINIDDSENELFAKAAVDHVDRPRRRTSILQQHSTTRVAKVQATNTAIPLRTNRGGSDLLLQDIQDIRNKMASLEKEVQQLSVRNNQDQRHQHHTSTQSSSNTASSFAHSSTVVQGGDDDPVLLRQVIQTLRRQLAVEEQEKREALEAAAVAIEAASRAIEGEGRAIDAANRAIESERVLSNKVTSMQQSVHGLWAMVARSETEKFTATQSGTMESTQQSRQNQQDLLQVQLDAIRRKLSSSGKTVFQS